VEKRHKLVWSQISVLLGDRYFPFNDVGNDHTAMQSTHLFELIALAEVVT
jgi:hypothetical protein